MAKIYSFETKKLLADLPTDNVTPPRNFNYGTYDVGPMKGIVFVIANEVDQARSVFRQVNESEELIAEAN